jgi:hypothetical protein
MAHVHHAGVALLVYMAECHRFTCGAIIAYLSVLAYRV